MDGRAVREERLTLTSLTLVVLDGMDSVESQISLKVPCSSHFPTCIFHPGLQWSSLSPLMVQKAVQKGTNTSCEAVLEGGTNG